ncbi:hypothetical protein EGJ34_07340 [Stenotrophomonas sp. 278]|nr:hypothetical protein EGJ34_07340 [Stenotrophomonas sp. 278]
MTCAFVGERTQRIEVKPPSGLTLCINYDQATRTFTACLVQRPTPSQVARGRSFRIACTLIGKPDQLPRRWVADGPVFGLGDTSFELGAASHKQVDDWLNHLSRLQWQAALKEPAA